MYIYIYVYIHRLLSFSHWHSLPSPENLAPLNSWVSYHFHLFSRFKQDDLISCL